MVGIDPMNTDENVKPTRAYDLLTDAERVVVDEYVSYVIEMQRHRRERIALALDYHIPAEFLRRSRGLLAKPIPRAALAERIREEANRQDLSPDRVIEEYRRIAHASMEDYFEPSPFGDMQLKHMHKIPSHLWSAVKGVEITPTMNGMKTRLVLYDKREALAALARLQGLIAPDTPPLLEEYSTDKGEQRRLMGSTPESVYAEMLDGG